MSYWVELKSWVLRDPAKLIRYLVLFVCSIVVIVQLCECFNKLREPPLSTHSYYNLNETIEMPAVTICRNPPYKQDIMSEISKSSCFHPKFANCWDNYPYDDVSLEEFFQNSTFTRNETFFQYGLIGLTSNVDISSSLHFNLGLCHTLRPKIVLKRTSINTGFSILLHHHIQPNEHSNIYIQKRPGWDIFIHDQRENFTEINVKGSGRMEYIFADINEEIEIKLQSQYFSNAETRHQFCSMVEGYSDIECGEKCIWNELVSITNCTGPWMSNIQQNPCSNNTSMRNLVKEYGIIYNSDEDIDCNCLQPCESRIFSTYIQNRKEFLHGEPYTQVWIYYTTKLISMIEERSSYDTTQFIADIGGSLGFLLGLSVLGVIGILEHLTLYFCGGMIKKVQKNQEKRKLEIDQQSQKSDETLDIAVAVACKEKLDKF